MFGSETFIVRIAEDALAPRMPGGLPTIRKAAAAALCPPDLGLCVLGGMASAGMIWCELCLVFEHGAGDGDQPVGDRA